MINTDFVTSTEGIRSFIFSAIIALFLGFQWLKKQREHKLKKFMLALLKIEEELIPIGQYPNANERESLDRLLNKVISLRQTAFREHSIHELSEDRAGYCFILMCQDVSSKINAKLSQQRVETSE